MRYPVLLNLPRNHIFAQTTDRDLDGMQTTQSINPTSERKKIRMVQTVTMQRAREG